MFYSSITYIRAILKGSDTNYFWLQCQKTFIWLSLMLSTNKASVNPGKRYDPSFIIGIFQASLTFASEARQP